MDLVDSLNVSFEDLNFSFGHSFPFFLSPNHDWTHYVKFHTIFRVFHFSSVFWNWKDYPIENFGCMMIMLQPSSRLSFFSLLSCKFAQIILHDLKNLNFINKITKSYFWSPTFLKYVFKNEVDIFNGFIVQSEVLFTRYTSSMVRLTDLVLYSI